MSDFIGIEITGDKELAERLGKLSPEMQDAGVESANAYVVNKQQAYIPYKYVSVAQSGGWKSERQRRYVMAAIRSGEISIPYSRTQNLRKGWKTLGTGRNQIIVNEVPYSKWVKDIKTQSQGHMLRGWDVIQDDLRNWSKGILQKFEEGVRKAQKKLGL